jgi:polyisoprenoid-binding protein YceI
MRALLLPALLLGVSLPAFAATYEVDPVHSQVGFSVTHMTVSTVRGVFGKVTGTVEYDPANVAATKVNGTVSIDSVDTNNADRDKHLVSPDFFDATQFPSMTFTSKAVKNVTKTTFDLVGDLTIRGVTKEVTFKVNRLAPDMKDPWGNVKSGTIATTTINRQDFGVAWNTKLDQGGYVVGDDVAISLELELLKK